MGFSIDAKIKPNGRKNKTGTYTIYLRLTVNRQIKYLNLEHKVEDRYWSGKNNHWIKDIHPFSSKINSYIASRKRALESFIIDYQFNHHSIPTLQQLIDFWKNYIEIESFNEFAEKYVDDDLNFNKPNTRKKYRTFIKHINAFNPNIPFNELNEYLFQDFADFMSKNLKLKGRTVEKYFDPFRKICAYAVKKQFMKKNPFDNKIKLDIKIEDPTVDKFLNKNERIQLLSVKVPADKPNLQRALLLWSGCFWLGCRYQDLIRLTWSNWKQYNDTYYIDTARSKNGNRFVVPVTHPDALKLFNGQRGKDPELIFPEAVTSKTHNEDLKELATLAKVNPNLAADYARGTALSYWIELGYTPEERALMMGHKSTKTQNFYYMVNIADLTRKSEQLKNL